MIKNLHLRLIFCFLFEVDILTLSYTKMSLLKDRVNICVGLNPALQRTIQLGNQLSLGGVNRALASSIGIGGKGQNVIVAGNCISQSPFSLLQFLGTGPEGDTLSNLLNKMSNNKFDFQYTVRTSSPCRTCITLVDPLNCVAPESTEIIEPSGLISEQEVRFVHYNNYFYYTTVAIIMIT